MPEECAQKNNDDLLMKKVVKDGAVDKAMDEVNVRTAKRSAVSDGTSNIGGCAWERFLSTQNGLSETRGGS